MIFELFVVIYCLGERRVYDKYVFVVNFNCLPVVYLICCMFIDTLLMGYFPPKLPGSWTRCIT